METIIFLSSITVLVLVCIALSIALIKKKSKNSDSGIISDKLGIYEKKLDIYEEDGSIVKYDKIFCASKYIDKLNMNLIINFTNIDSVSEKIILEEYQNIKLCDFIENRTFIMKNSIKEINQGNKSKIKNRDKNVR